MNAFTKGSWIWTTTEPQADSYAEFRDIMSYTDGNAHIRLSCDSDYTLWINDRYVASGQYGDFPHYKIYDDVDISPYLKSGENRLDILVHYFGVPSQRYYPSAAGLLYEVICGGNLLAYSSEATLSRISPTYASGLQKKISEQLGFSFYYDATKETEDGYHASVCVEKICDLYPRPIKKSKIIQSPPMRKVIRNSDTHFLIDLGEETVGTPVLEFASETEQEITVAYGEHIIDGGVRRIIREMDFSYQYRAKPGENRFQNYMLRLACRYLEIFSERPIELRYVGVLPQIYEIAEKPCVIKGALERKLYDLCVNTLRLCMMEHYVDCPWREQGLYAFDSRNQMLFGYRCFEGGNAEYARANLKLIGEDRREDGLLSICAPCGSSLAIPSFSLHWLTEMREYMDFTGDFSLAKEMFGKMTEVLQSFLNNMEGGLVLPFDGKQMWNFYDWSEYAVGGLGAKKPICAELILNCLLVLALDHFEEICKKIGKKFPYIGVSDDLRQRIRESFRMESGLYTMKQDTERVTVLGNAVAVLAKVTNELESRAICDSIVSGNLPDCSLSMKIMVYDALLNTDTDRYRGFVLEDIFKQYRPMLEGDSSTVWETAKGAEDFDRAGSLCHGWSAIPIYIYHRLGIAEER